MPLDHRLQGIDHKQGRDFAVLERRARRIAKAEPADHNVPLAARQLGQSAMRERNLHLVKQTRHQERVAQLHLVDFGAA